MPRKFLLKIHRYFLKPSLARLFFLVIPRRLPSIKHQKIGLNLVGYYSGDLGLGEALRYLAKAIHGTTIPFLVRQLKARLLSGQSNQTLNSFLSPECKYPINCIVINPDLIHRLPMWVRYPEWAQRYNIGYWFWELENFPQEWRYSIPLVDEIWVNTEFVANAMRQAHKRVIKIPFAVEFETPSTQYTRQYFSLPESGFLFICTFDFQSSVNRKNPKASIKAFLEAFPSSESNTLLIIKSINAHLHPKLFDDLKIIAQSDPRILFIDKNLNSTEMRGLLQCADCYVSLHRSEGLGLGMAESMFLGKPVIATAYSGNLEFMNEKNACLIPYKKIPVGKDEYLYTKNQVWADPNIPDAVSAMQKIFNDSDFRFNLGKNAREYMHEYHSLAVMGAAIKMRTEEIKALLS